MLKDFKEFAMRGSVVDLAVGVIIGAAFGKIVTSLVNDIIMPPIGLILGRVDFSQLVFNLNTRTFGALDAAKKANQATINYGIFLDSVLDFVIVAFCVFLLIQQMNRWFKKPAPAAAPTTKECPQCAMTIPTQAKRCGHCTAQLAA